MRKEPYEAEHLLQELIAHHPELLCGNEMDPDRPRRWILVERESGVPDHEGAGSRWAVDHFFLDQDAVPTLIEVKRATDTRTRREVVAQMLDYAANAVAYWSTETLVARFQETCRQDGVDPAERLGAVLREGQSAEEFWQQVGVSLTAGRIRMVFLADGIPPELLRIVEFLNDQMRPAEVLAVEVPRFASGDGLVAYVPRLVGRTDRAIKRKAAAATGGPRGSAVLLTPEEAAERVEASEVLSIAKVRLRELIGTLSAGRGYFWRPADPTRALFAWSFSEPVTAGKSTRLLTAYDSKRIEWQMGTVHAVDSGLKGVLETATGLALSDGTPNTPVVENMAEEQWQAIVAAVKRFVTR